MFGACTIESEEPSTRYSTSSTGGSTGAGGAQAEPCDPIGSPLLEGSAPSQRGDMATAAQSRCQRVMMWFGDQAVPKMCNFPASDFLSDGYLYDAITGGWYSLEANAGSPSPTRRARARGVWDDKRDRFVLFGGRFREGTSGAYTFLNDVWAFDPETMSWTELSPHGEMPGVPGGRMNFSLAADAAGDRMIVHGGGTTDFSTFFIDSDTWAFNFETNSWTQLATAAPQPPARIFHAAAFDQQRQQLYVFAGGSENAFLETMFKRDMWRMDLATQTWSQVQGFEPWPLGRIKGEMLYDGDRDRLLLFGGHDDSQIGNNNELWSFDLASQGWKLEKQGDTFNAPALGFCDFPSNFANIDPASPERRESHLFEPAGDAAIMYGGRTDCGLAKDTWSLDLNTLEWTQDNESFVGMTCYRSGSLSCDEPGAKMCI
jgi:hypothetical protein